MKFSLFLLFIFSLLTSSCEKRVSLVSHNHILSNDSVIMEDKYAVVRSNFLRVKESPIADAKGMMTLYLNDVVKVNLKVSQVGGWCEITSPGLSGWVPVAELVLFDDLKSAKAYQGDVGRLSETRKY